FRAEDGIRDFHVTGVQTCALPIYLMDIDVESYIENAKKEGDFALAIRYLNQLNIQLLAKRELIHWKYTKSHVELIEEIENEELRSEERREGKKRRLEVRMWPYRRN